MKTLTLIFLALCSLNGFANEKINCPQILKNIGSFSQVESPVKVTPQIPEDGIIQEFSIKILKRENGELLHPKTLKESVCVLDIMLDSKTREALRQGVNEYLSSTPTGLPEENFNKLWGSINNRLNALYVNSAMVKNTGVNLILARMEEQLDIRLFGGAANHSPLQKQAAKEGIYNPNLVARWVWVVYLKYLDVEGFDEKPFISYLKSLD